VDELMARVRSYDRGLWYQTVSELEDSFDIDGMREAKKRLVQVGQKLLDALRPVLGERALHLTGGGCGLCERCGKLDGVPCRFPDRALASVESYGMDVYNTTKNTPLKYINGENTVTYFGMVLFSEEKEN
jgi:predicted metal-binding protein